MKNLYAIFIALAMPFLLMSQNTITKTYPINNSFDVSIEFEYGNVTLEKYNGSEIIVEGIVSVNGKDGSEYFEITSNKSANTLYIRAKADFENVEHRITIIMNDGTKIYKDGKNISIENIDKSEGVDKVINGVNVEANFTIKIPESLNLNVESTYGKVSVNDYWEAMKLHSTYGSVDVVLNNPPKTPNMEITSTYSEVDLTIPTSVNAELRMISGYGEIFTDMDIQPEYKAKGNGCDFGQDISATLNNGKGSIKLDATYSNIYLRKTK